MNLPILHPKEILRRVHERIILIKSLEAEGTLTIETPQNSGTTGFELQLKRPDSLWMKFTGPFGTSLGTLMLSRKKVIFYNARENRRFVGSSDVETLERLFNIALSFDDIIDAVAGSFNVVDRDETVNGVDISEGHYVLDDQTDRGRREVWVDGETFVTTKFAEFDSAGKLTLTGSASRLERINDIHMPFLIRIIFPKRRQSLTIAYSTLSINSELQKRFSFPNDTAEIYIDKSR